MAECIYCSKSAGFLRKKHKECEQVFNQGKQDINLLIESFITNDQEISVIANRISSIAVNSFITQEIQIEIIFEKWEAMINDHSSLLDSSIDKLEKINVICEYYNLQRKNTVIFEKFNNLIIQKLSKNYAQMIYSVGIDQLNVRINEDIARLKLNANTAFIKKLAVNTIEDAIYEALEDGLITVDKERAIICFKNNFNFTNDDLSENESFQKLVKSLVLRDIFNGILPKRLNVTNQIPFVLQKNETLIWLINDVDYYVDKEKKHYVGASQGISLRIARGVYYRVGAFKGQPVVTTEKVYMGKGILGFTNKHLYFVNYSTSFRVKYDKMVSIIPKSDGIIILKDGATAKQQTFIDRDGWFSYNLITNLSQIDL
ncbi:MAG: hypothetical protein M0Q21_01025 [Ignavibacteriaceae bacterium]|nr:hypothetical protein [Ignavibacteriaceae bacterium]